MIVITACRITPWREIMEAILYNVISDSFLSIENHTVCIIYGAIKAETSATVYSTQNVCPQFFFYNEILWLINNGLEKIYTYKGMHESHARRLWFLSFLTWLLF